MVEQILVLLSLLQIVFAVGDRPRATTANSSNGTILNTLLLLPKRSHARAELLGNCPADDVVLAAQLQLCVRGLCLPPLFNLHLLRRHIKLLIPTLLIQKVALIQPPLKFRIDLNAALLFLLALAEYWGEISKLFWEHSVRWATALAQNVPVMT